MHHVLVHVLLHVHVLVLVCPSACACAMCLCHVLVHVLLHVLVLVLVCPSACACAYLDTGCTDMRLRLAHIVRQRTIQGQFTWHQDHDENGDFYHFSTSMVTVVILLSGQGSGMQMWGFRVFPYSGVGVAAAFPGAATHRSACHGHGGVGTDVEGPPEEVVKLSLFFE